MTFVKGKSGNPSGRPIEPASIIQARKLNRSKVEEYLNRYLNMDIAELREFLKGGKGTVLEFMIATIAKNGIEKGDTVRMDALLNRLIGKVPDVTDITVRNPFRDLSPEEKLAKARLAVALLEGKPDEKVED